MKKIVLTLLGGLIAFHSPASATDWNFDAKISMIEATYIPNQIVFWADNGAGSCPAGTILRWTPPGADQAAKTANIQAVLSMMTTALVSGKKMRLFGNNTNCAIEFIYLIAT